MSGHTLIAGITESGKTTLAKKMCAEYKARGIPVVVLDPMNDPEWLADFQTREPLEFLQMVKTSRNCACFVDEGSENAGRFDTEMHWTATKGRHLGHRLTYVCQRPTQISPNIRYNCSNVALFKVAMDDAKTVANDFGQEALKRATLLKQGEYLYCNGFSSVQMLRVF